MDKIRNIEVFAIGLPVTRPFNFASGSAGKVGDNSLHALVKVTDNQGRTGWGAARPVPGWSYETFESVLSTLRDYLAPAAVGLSCWEVETLEKRMNTIIGRGPSPGHPIARSALDTAFWDLRAKSAGVPLRCLIGGSVDSVTMPLSWTCTAHDPEAMRDDVESGRKLGYRHFNFKAAVSASTDIACAEALIQAAPEDAFRWADCNQGFSLHEAVRVGEAFHEMGIHVLEQPLAADQLPGMRRLRQRLSIPLAVDESSVGDSDFFQFAAEGLVDYLVIKLPRSGGITTTLRQMAIARAAGLSYLVSGLSDCFLTKMASLQVAAAYGVTGPSALNGSQFIDEAELFPAKSELEQNGGVLLGDAPGIGVEPDEQALRKFTL